MRDHTKLRAFQVADQLVVAVYAASRSFPRAEQFGLTSQIRRAAVSIASNIVEGCARSSEMEYLRFLELAYGSAREVEYQDGVCTRLGYLEPTAAGGLAQKCAETSKTLAALIKAIRKRCGRRG